MPKFKYLLYFKISELIEGSELAELATLTKMRMFSVDSFESGSKEEALNYVVDCRAMLNVNAIAKAFILDNFDLDAPI